MKISFNWLKDYLPTDLSPEQIAEILTDTGLEVEKTAPFETLPGGLKGVVVGQVLEASQHPNADRLKVTKVDVGGDTPLDIVCGAPNVAAGQKVIVATVGAVLHPKGGDSFKIKRAKIRGEVSEGMICAEDELGIGESHDGIMVLPEHVQVGTSAADYFGAYSDWVFEIGLTPNRTDAFGHFGVARDIAARLSLKAKTRAALPEIKELNIENATAGPIKVAIEDPDGCGRYAGLCLTNVKVAPSPAWLQNRLRAIGLSPINNVVDITNYVLQETGQPLHAFDAGKIAGGQVLVKPLPQDTPFTTLDGVERKLHAEDLMICDTSGGMCIAGVFGGMESGVGAHTTDVFLESAWFNPVRVRKTAKRHALNTDASFRFERGVDPEGTLYALKRAAQLMVEICGASVQGQLIDIKTRSFDPVKLKFSLERCNALCGTSLLAAELETILSALDFKVETEAPGKYKLTVPTYRADVTREVDVVEEVLRIYGYNRVARPGRMQISVAPEPKPTRQEVFEGISAALAGRGFAEMMANGLTRSDYLKTVMGEQAAEGLVYMLNPLSQELDVLRPNLICSALDAVAYNLNRQAERLQFFELGSVYRKEGKKYAENTHLSLAICGDRAAENWNNAVIPFDISDMRGQVSGLLNLMGLRKGIEIQAVAHPFLDGGMAVIAGGVECGFFGAVSAKALKVYGIKKAVFVAELNLDVCMKLVQHAAITIADIPRFPSVRRDFSLLVDAGVEFDAIRTIASKKAGKLLRDIGLFDVYEGKNLPEGKKSYAVRFILQDPLKTLTDEEIDQTMRGIQKGLEETLGATLR